MAFTGRDARFEMSADSEWDDPALDEWVPFQVNVRDDFLKLWGAVPEYEKIRVLFEVRYDDKAKGEGPAEADVYYDDLYFGPAP